MKIQIMLMKKAIDQLKRTLDMKFYPVAVVLRLQKSLTAKRKNRRNNPSLKHTEALGRKMERRMSQ